ncbi:MAG: hypothetical protein IPF83_07680 [Rhodanobacteraceae bacterium]|nr:hypothetical protein [Rhodanobacteraceae bacterium]MBK7043314.1 hypothetical protein [Rhodanobacteraceae bacterium]MBP9155032.1 hypothetical protein [Xanthomonadales bacterium]HQW81228.1 hypothetical protein [Pseudomonadota bacterium]
MSAALSKATPVLFVERIEHSLPFFEAIGLAKVMDVPHGDHLGFCILSDGKLELMLQSFDSLAADMPQLADAARGKSFLFVEVPDLAAVEAALASHTLFLPRRTTFYGADETGFIEPGGHYVTFAQFAKDA